LFYIPGFIWQPKGRGLINLAKLVQNSIFLVIFFKISRNLRQNILLKNLFFTFGEILPKQKRCLKVLCK
jgi:hypothetical protein